MKFRPVVDKEGHNLKVKVGTSIQDKPDVNIFSLPYLTIPGD